jgi:anaerobic selenocysteine-containing dehydrogenase
VQEVIAKVIPGYQALSDIIATRQEFHIPGRRLSTAKFPTASGRARFKGVAIPRHAGAVEQLRLMTVRSEGQFNTVVYEEEDIYRGQDRRNVILMNSHDIARLGLHVDQEVTVRSAVGVMHGIRVRAFDIRAGNALMYYPEANVLVPTTTDPESRTPAFKNVLVEVVAQVPSRNPGNGVDPSGKRVPLTMSPG